MRRRDFIGGLGGAAAFSLVARAEQSQHIPVIGVLWHGSSDREWSNQFYHWLHDDFAAAGYIAGKTVRYEERYASDRKEMYGQLAGELVALSPDVLIAPTTPAALALKKTTSRIPIVFLGVADPVGSGLVKSFAEPGGNVTGLAAPSRETYLKRVAILKEIIPTTVRLALVENLNEPSHSTLERELYAEAATASGIKLDAFSASDKPTIDEAFSKIVQAKSDGVIIANQGSLFLLRDELSQAALSNRLPSMAPSDYFVPSGILISYAPNLRVRCTQLVAYAIRILKGAAPNDLPVDFPTKFELKLNLKTAVALGVTIPTTVLAIADEVIE